MYDTEDLIDRDERQMSDDARWREEDEQPSPLYTEDRDFGPWVRWNAEQEEA